MSKKNNLPEWTHPKDLDEVILFMKNCMSAYGFGKKDSSFACNANLHIRNKTFKIEDCFAVIHFDVDYENGDVYITKSMSAKYNVKTYKNMISDIKNMISGAEKLSEFVFIGNKFLRPMFKKLGLESKGWEIIH